MRLSELLQSAYDHWRPNRYGLKTYLIRDGKTHPFAVICPGGAYHMVCSYVEGMPFAKALNARGYHAFVVYYRTGEKSRYPHPQEDLQRGIKEILAHAEDWRLETEGWSLWGSSAGGHLAASYCAEEWDAPKPAALVLVYPVVTMGEHTHLGSRENLLGKDADVQMIERLSVEKQINSSYPPTFVWNGKADTLVDPINSRMMETALEQAGVAHLAEEYEGIEHGVGLALDTNAEPWFEHAVVFWEQQRSNR